MMDLYKDIDDDLNHHENYVYQFFHQHEYHDQSKE